MKKSILLLMLGALTFGCASVYTPAGNWDYTVVGTPNGDVSGTMVLNENEGVYTGKFVSDMGELELEDVNYSEEEGLNCKFWIQGMEFSVKGTFDDDDFKGTVDGGSQMGTWPMNAKRVVEKDN